MIKYVSLHKQYIHQIKRRITFEVFILCSFSQPVTQYTKVLEILQVNNVYLYKFSFIRNRLGDTDIKKE